MRSVSLFESHVSAIRPHHALAIRQHEENPRAQTRVTLRVQGGPSARRVSDPRPRPHPAEHRSRRRAAALTPGAAVHPRRRIPRPDDLLRRRGHRARLPRARLRATGIRGGHRCCPGRPHKRQSASRGPAETTCWNARLHTLPGLLSQPDRTRHRRCFHRLPVNRGAHTGAWGARRIRTPAETRWTGTPATVHLSGLDTGASTAHVVDRHVQPSRRLTRKADDLPWSVLAHASGVVTRGRLASGSHGLRWRAREGSFGIPAPGWPGAVSSVADPAGRRSHHPRSGRPARAAPGTGGSLTPANAPQWLQEPLSRHTEGEKVSCGCHPPDLRRAVAVCWRVEARRLDPLSPARENVHTMESVTLTQKEMARLRVLSGLPSQPVTTERAERPSRE